jgi:hypothetical protein
MKICVLRARRRFAAPIPNVKSSQNNGMGNLGRSNADSSHYTRYAEQECAYLSIIHG